MSKSLKPHLHRVVPEVDSNPDSGPPNGGGPGDPDRDLDQLRLHGADSRTGSRKVVSCKRGFRSLGLIV